MRTSISAVAFSEGNYKLIIDLPTKFSFLLLCLTGAITSIQLELFRVRSKGICDVLPPGHQSLSKHAVIQSHFNNTLNSNIRFQPYQIMLIDKTRSGRRPSLKRELPNEHSRV